MLTLYVDEAITARLTKDRRTVVTEPERNRRRCRITPARDVATLFEI